eukprot:TRINITY_DN11727_c0_g1_i1.p1 TRINITY_DN11727_c0_g1~~TRINITY_DN11727_c0_g1_i1.p1  ORF type:complete len:379 (-),score=109.03 TRINITY_DN11727_c0_g1_i1:190-1326(-)
MSSILSWRNVAVAAGVIAVAYVFNFVRRKGAAGRRRVKQLDVVVYASQPDMAAVEDAVRYVVITLVDEWSRAVPEAIVIEPVAGGTTNFLFRCTNPHSSQLKHMLVRVFGDGTEALVDREIELQRFEVLRDGGLGPPLYGSFRNGYVYGFAEGRPLTAAELKDERFVDRIASQLAHWHQIDFPSARTPGLYQKIDKWLSLVPAGYHDPLEQAQFEKLDIAAIRAQWPQFRAELEAMNSPIVYCHNDVNSANLIYDGAADSLQFIDYEYACYNPRAFDLANHFCEHAGLEQDEASFPSIEYQRRFLKCYLTAYTGAPVTTEQVDALHREVHKFVQASHFFWAVWALLQADFSNLDSLDFMKYAVTRFILWAKLRRSGPS